MARFKFGKKKRDTDADVSITSNETSEDRHSYLRRPSLSSKTNPDRMSQFLTEDESHSYEVADNNFDVHDSPRDTNGLGSPLPPATVLDPSSPTVSASPWKRHKLFDSPFPRYRHAASGVSSDKNDVYIMGGLKEGSVFGDTWKIVPQLSPLGKEINGLVATHIDILNDNNPPARVGHASVLCGNAFILYGGDTVDTDYNGFPDDNFYMFNINNRKYTIPLHILNKPRGRYGHSLGVVLLSSSSSRLYLFGGQLENDVYNDLYYFELTSFKSPKARWELVEPLNNLKPPPLTNHSMSIYKNKIYVFGGVYNNEKVSNDLWCYDTLSNKWLQIVTLGDVPFPINEHSACIILDRLYIYGGNDFSGVIYDSFYCLNLHSLKWTKLAKEFSANGPGPRCGHSMTYLPKLNKILVMGGDKNDYISSDAGNYDTFENLNGPEVGTMIFELDVEAVDNIMNGLQSRKLAASAGGGAAAALNRRPVSPLPSEDAFTRHRRSMSNGPDDFRTPTASVERVNRSLDPNKTTPTLFDTAAVATGTSALNPAQPVQQEDPVAEKFVDVDIPSSTATSVHNGPSGNLNEIRDRYLFNGGQDDTFSHAEEQSDKASIEDDRALQNNTPVLVKDYGITSDEPVEEPVSNRGFDARSPSKLNEPNGTRNGLDDVAQQESFVAATTPAYRNSIKSDNSAKRGIQSPSKSTARDEKSEKLIAQLRAEIEELKAGHRAKLRDSELAADSAKSELLALRQSHAKELENKAATHDKMISEKDGIIEELRRTIDPADLEVSDNDVDSTALSQRGFTELTKYKLIRLELMNKLVYLEDENAKLREKHVRFEPFMNNQMKELSSLQKVMKKQEDQIALLTEQVRLELVLHKEIASWRHKYEDLELEFKNYRLLHTENLVEEESEPLDPAGSRDIEGVATTSPMGQNRKVSTKLDNLILLWSSASAQGTREVSGSNETVVNQLQKQIDDLLVTSKLQHEGVSAEVKALEDELQAKLFSLKTFEANYRDALQSVQNTSKALDLTQDELRLQKVTMEKLVKENNELKMFKRAANASRSVSGTPVNGGSPNVTEEESSGEFTAAHYNMKLKDIEADLYIMRQERDQLNDVVTLLKKELYLAKA